MVAVQKASKNTSVASTGIMALAGRPSGPMSMEQSISVPPGMAGAAMDSITESRIQSAFDALSVGRTTLIIAHRLSTIRSAKTVLVVAGGRIQERGSHEELVKKDGLYAELLRTQNLLAR